MDLFGQIFSPRVQSFLLHEKLCRRKVLLWRGKPWRRKSFHGMAYILTTKPLSPPEWEAWEHSCKAGNMARTFAKSCLSLGCCGPTCSFQTPSVYCKQVNSRKPSPILQEFLTERVTVSGASVQALNWYMGASEVSRFGTLDPWSFLCMEYGYVSWKGKAAITFMPCIWCLCSLPVCQVSNDFQIAWHTSVV